jgi:FMN-dependent NADH-azoreductase
MTKLLFIKASPRDEASRSIAVAKTYLDALKAGHPNLEIDAIDLWKADLPEFDGDKNTAKLTVFGGGAPDGAIKTAWEDIVAIANRFIRADRYLFAVPMWNGGIPYKLKQYIDLIHQPGLTFSFDPKSGYSGLLKNKRATIVYTSGAFSRAFPSPAFGVDHQSTYLKAWLAEAGVTAVEEIRFQPTILTADSDGDFAKAKLAAAEAGAAA